MTERGICKKIITVITASALIFSMAMTSPYASAGSKNKKALKAYRDMLEDEDVANKVVDTLSDPIDRWKFALVDINRDGVDELVFTPDKGYHVDIVTYSKGELKEVGYGYAGIEEFFPGSKVYHSTTTAMGSDEEFYYKYNGKKMVKVAYKYGSDSYNAVTGKQKKKIEYNNYEPYRYEIKDKVVSKKKYDKYIKKLLKGSKKEKVNYIKNSKKNRDKYLG